MGERIKSYDDKLTDLKAELRTLGDSIADTQLDIGDLTKDIGELASGGESESATDKLGTALSDIDLQERAGILSPEQARAARIATLTAAQGGAFGALDQRQQWEVMGQLREAQQAATQAMADLTSELTGLRTEMARQNAFNESIMGRTMAELSRGLGDWVSGELGGRINSRGAMPNAGALMRV
jgi:hypothetical protein